MREERIKKKKRHLNIKRFLIFLFIIVIIFYIIYSICNIKITQIEINGTNMISDLEIIEMAEIKDYPRIFSAKSFGIKNRLKKLDLVNDVKISRDFFGKLTINIDEANVLFYNKSNDKIVLSNKKEIDFNQNYLGVPTLINYVPNDIYNKLIEGLNYVDKDVLKMISEIEYSPFKTKDGDIIDDTRFLLRMNDTNLVYMNTINIKKMNKYIELASAFLATNDESHGILYLDSAIDGSYYFESYESIARAEEEAKKAEEEAEKEKEKEKKDEKPSSN